MTHTSSRRGFTVVELLVATAITAVMAALLISITSGVMGVWNRSRGALTTANQVKLALDQLATDLEGALFRNDGDVWFAATILETNNTSATITAAQLESQRGWVVSGAGSSRIKPESDSGSTNYDARNLRLDAAAIDDCTFGRAGVWLRFFTVRAASNADVSSLSAPVAVSYQICRRRVGSGSDDGVAYMLFRGEVRETGTGTAQDAGVFQIGYDLDPGASNAYSVASSVAGNPGNVMSPNATQVLANNIVDFGVRLYVREGTAFRLIFPAQRSTAGAAPLAGAASTTTTTAIRPEELSHLVSSRADVFSSVDAYRHVKPDVVEVMVRVLTDEGAARLRAYEAGLSPGNWWDIAMANSRIFTRRIEVKGDPL